MTFARLLHLIAAAAWRDKAHSPRYGKIRAATHAYNHGNAYLLDGVYRPSTADRRRTHRKQ